MRSPRTPESAAMFDLSAVQAALQQFEACWDDDQWAMHLEASKLTRAAYDRVFRFIADAARKGRPVTETQAQAHIMDYFAANQLVTDHPPIVGVGPHSADPHFAPA